MEDCELWPQWPLESWLRSSVDMAWMALFYWEMSLLQVKWLGGRKPPSKPTSELSSLSFAAAPLSIFFTDSIRDNVEELVRRNSSVFQRSWNFHQQCCFPRSTGEHRHDKCSESDVVTWVTRVLHHYCSKPWSNIHFLSSTNTLQHFYNFSDHIDFPGLRKWRCFPFKGLINSLLKVLDSRQL